MAGGATWFPSRPASPLTWAARNPPPPDHPFSGENDSFLVINIVCFLLSRLSDNHEVLIALQKVRDHAPLSKNQSILLFRKHPSFSHIYPAFHHHT